ncbi:MAG: flagellar motor protein MotA [Ignavibacteriae bacterium HGW-Ignavibacteriae-2]|jgi:biopolymer transport protein ExbB|nr:MotA/TolQ/ExbB proton channel family protein [Bacteroidota bacterium]PKL87688.1 MAG: flagellar motor protein MotA [Ignavibacteriae bacterium HGW-Ignavibacteriae-2]
MQISEIIGFVSYVIAQAQDSGVLTYLQEKFVAGGGFMWPILACLVLGLGFALERMWTLSRASMNTKKFILSVKDALQKGGVEEAMKVCENTRGSIASVFHAGLLRADEGVEAAEKAIMAYGSIEMGFLERGLIWISTFITIAPMLGFTGTVQGMIQAFDAIAAAAQISPAVVAIGISVALLTTLFGLVTAMILQVFYNYFISRIDKLVADMEESSIELIDALYEMKK